MFGKVIFLILVGGLMWLIYKVRVSMESREQVMVEQLSEKPTYKSENNFGEWFENGDWSENVVQEDQDVIFKKSYNNLTDLPKEILDIALSIDKKG